MRQVIIHPDREDGGFSAEVPSLPDCIEVWISGARDVGMPVTEET